MQMQMATPVLIDIVKIKPCISLPKKPDTTITYSLNQDYIKYTPSQISQHILRQYSLGLSHYI